MSFKTQCRQNWILVFSHIILFCVTFASAALFAQDKKDGKEKKKLTTEEYYKMMKVFADTFEQIDRNYVKEVDSRELMEAAIAGMLLKLDRYSSYISPKDLARFNQSVEQEFGGIGIQVQVDPKANHLVVTSPMPGTPAYKGGVRAGDIIMEIEGKPALGFTIDDAVKLIKGKAGGVVNIGVRHVGENKVVKIRLVREIIRVSTVLGDRYKKDDKWNYMLDEKNKIGYIRLTNFSRHSAEELTKALKILQKENMKGLILDLRFNPGGLLSQAITISDMFIEKGKIVSTKGRNTPEQTWNAKKPGTLPNFPMTVLINHYSASASEILSACLQDHQRAVVIGERSWGKGSVQNVIKLEGGNSALKLTTASYHRPSGKNIHRFPGAKKTDEWGVMPNKGFKIPIKLKEWQKYLVYRRNRDILGKKNPPKSDYKDKQLEKAREYLLQQFAGSKAAAFNDALPKKAPLKNIEVIKQSLKKKAKARAEILEHFTQQRAA